MPGQTVRRPLPCAKCGYDLEGLSVPGNCPECGHAILATLESAVDPAVAVLAPPASPERRLAWAVHLACVGLLLGVGTVLRPTLRAVLGFSEAGSDGFASRVDSWLGPALESLGLMAALVGALAGFVGLVVVAPLGRTRTLLRARLLGGLGFVVLVALALVLMLADGQRGAPVFQLLGIALVLTGISPVFREIGARSKVYRTRWSAKQQIHVLLVAAGLAFAAALGSGALAGAGSERLADLADLARLLSGVSAALLAIGLAYLAANSFWILRAVLRPPPTLKDLLEPRE